MKPRKAQEGSRLRNCDLRLISAIGSSRDVREVKRRPRVEGVYNVCGSHPWLLIVKPLARDSKSDAETEDLDLRSLKTGVGSTAYRQYVWPDGDRPIDVDFPGIQTFMFIRPKKEASALGRVGTAYRRIMKDIKSGARYSIEPRRILLLDECEWWFLLEATFPTIGMMREFIGHLLSAKFDTATKFVLVRWKDRGEVEQYVRHNRSRSEGHKVGLSKPSPDWSYATIFRNYPAEVLQGDRTQTTKRAARIYDSAPDPSVNSRPSAMNEALEYDLSGCYVWRDQLRYEVKYLDRKTIRPNARPWKIFFVFLKAQHERWIQLRDRLVKQIGVEKNYIIPRVYQITGDYDAIVPIYSAGEDYPGDFYDGLPPDLVSGVPMTLISRLPDSPLASFDVPQFATAREFVHALLRNADQVLDCENAMSRELARIENGWPAKSGGDSVDEELPGCQRAVLGSLPITPDQAKRFPQTIRQLGFEVAIEVDASLLESQDGGAALVRFFSSNRESVRKIVDQIKALKKNNTIAIDYFLRDRPEVMCICRFEKRLQLEQFLFQMQSVCERSEFHLILASFTRGRNLASEFECAPCAFPYTFDLQSVATKNCAHCGRYLRGLSVTSKIRVELPSSCQDQPHSSPRGPSWSNKSDRLVNVALLDLQLSPIDLFELGAVPNGTGDGKEVIRIDYADAATWRRAARERAIQWGNLLYDSVISSDEFLSADIAVLPEYSVPLDSLRTILRLMNKEEFRAKRSKDLLLALGSHIDTRGFNSCPIVYVPKFRQDMSAAGALEVYFQQKNHRADIEKQGLIDKEGRGNYLFKTKVGNVLPLICVDGYTSYTGLLADVDMLLAPSYHSGRWTSLPQTLRGLSHSTRTAVVFANGAINENSKCRSQIWVPGRKQAPQESAARVVLIGSRKGSLLATAVDLLALDTSRARATRGAAEHGVFPIHVDNWPARTRKKYKGQCLERLREAKTREGRPRLLKNAFTMDWEEAAKIWEK